MKYFLQANHDQNILAFGLKHLHNAIDVLCEKV